MPPDGNIKSISIRLSPVARFSVNVTAESFVYFVTFSQSYAAKSIFTFARVLQSLLGNLLSVVLFILTSFKVKPRRQVAANRAGHVMSS